MNYPMLYWFVPREMVALVKFLLMAGLLLGVAWMAWTYFKGVADREARLRRMGWVGLLVLLAGGLLAGNEVMERRQAEARRQYVREAVAHFERRCATAYITYYKAVPPQDGVFIMKPAQTPTFHQLADQYWMGDPVDMPDTPDQEAKGLLYRQKSLPKGSRDANQRGGFDFVEAPGHDSSEMWIRFRLVPDGRKDYNGYDLNEVKGETANSRRSRYGYTWDDISTPEDRKYWVAGGRLRVVDLETGEVVAERVGYVFERYFGATSSTFNQSPWRSARECRNGSSASRYRREFISRALGTWDELNEPGGLK